MSENAPSETVVRAWARLVRAQHKVLRAVETDLRKAITARPNWFKPHWTLARLMQTEGRAADAQHEQTLAVALGGGKHPELSADSPLH